MQKLAHELEAFVVGNVRSGLLVEWLAIEVLYLVSASCKYPTLALTCDI
jgi:hypothetical protein